MKLAHAAVAGAAAGAVLALAELAAALLVAHVDTRTDVARSDVITRDQYDAVHAAARRAQADQ